MLCAGAADDVMITVRQGASAVLRAEPAHEAVGSEAGTHGRRGIPSAGPRRHPKQVS